MFRDTRNIFIKAGLAQNNSILLVQIIEVVKMVSFGKFLQGKKGSKTEVLSGFRSFKLGLVFFFYEVI